MFLKNVSIFIFVLLSFSVLADETDSAKNKIISNITNSISTGLENIIGGEGATEVQLTAGQDYHPEFSIMAVRPITLHPEVDAWFIQLQLNDTKIRGDERFSINTGVGYRKLSEDKSYFSGANTFIDYDEEGNARASFGFELRSSAFEAIANYYTAISGAQTVGAYTERALDGIDVSIIGELPYLPWANLIFNHYEWQADEGSSDSEGEKYSLELTLTPNFIVEAGGDDNTIDGYNRFVKAYFVFPGREKVAASTNFIGESAFSKGNMSSELLSKVRRTNKIVIESAGSGVVMARGN